MAPHSSTLAWKIPWGEEPGRLQSMGREESDTTERLHFHFSLSRTGEGNGNPFQCSLSSSVETVCHLVLTEDTTTRFARRSKLEFGQAPEDPKGQTGMKT